MISRRSIMKLFGASIPLVAVTPKSAGAYTSGKSDGRYRLRATGAGTITNYTGKDVYLWIGDVSIVLRPGDTYCGDDPVRKISSSAH